MASCGRASLRSYLAGKWAVRKEARQRRANCESVVFRGEAHFTPTDEGLDASEHVVTTRNGKELEGKRHDIIRMTGPWSAEVFYDPGANGEENVFFHHLDVCPGIARVRHDCGEDKYEGLWRLKSEDEFEVTWEVNGPRKNLSIVATYTKHDGAQEVDDGSARNRLSWA